MSDHTAEKDDIVKGVVGWMLDESDDIEGTRLNLGDEPGPWVHTTAQVQDWLRERLPAAIRHYMSIPPAQRTDQEPS